MESSPSERSNRGRLALPSPSRSVSANPEFRSFAQILEDLSAAHEREVLALKADIDTLKDNLNKATNLVNPESHLRKEAEIQQAQQAQQEELAVEGFFKELAEKKDQLRGLRARGPRFADEDSVHGDTDSDEEVFPTSLNHESSTSQAEEVDFDPDAGRYQLRKDWWQSPMHIERPLIGQANSIAVNSNVREMRETIEGGEQSASSRDIRPRRLHRNQTSLSLSTDSVDVGSMWCMMTPGEGKFRISWDIAGMVLIAYDIVAIPLQVAFEPAKDAFSNFMGWLTLIFWSIDMIFSICTAYFDSYTGLLVTNRWRIVLNYLKCWFWVDCIVVVPDWTLRILGSGDSWGQLGRVLRAARAVRVLRLLRLLKLRRMLDIVYDKIDSEKMFLSFSLLKLLLMILVMNHLVACAWFMVGRLTSEVAMFKADRNWLEDAGQTPVKSKESLAWRYLTSLHWSITQFTPASMDISATNELERLFSIVILFWALLALSSIIGSVTASMTALRNISTEENKHFWTLRRYLRQNLRRENIEHSEFMSRIFRFLEARSQKTQNVVPEVKVVLLNQLSDSFRYQLANYITSKYIRCHPFFGYLIEDDSTKSLMWRLCYIAVTGGWYAEDDVVFTVDDEGKAMYFVKSGKLSYELAGLAEPIAVQHIKAWMSEGVLWTDWRHKGTMKAQTDNVELLLVTPAPFIKELRLNPRTWQLGQEYGFKYVDHINRLMHKRHGALTDFLFERSTWTNWIKAIVAKQNGGVASAPTSLLFESSRCPEGVNIDDYFHSEPLATMTDATETSGKDSNSEVIEL